MGYLELFRNNLNEFWDSYHGTIDKSVNKHLKTHRRSHIVPFLLKLKEHLNPSPTTSDVIKITQFNKEKIWSVWCKDI
jgi:hypothetical protein